ncbi:transglycosylase domain-containing protein [Streptomyces sp. NPDC016172]|uniref:transglycosylase domain-containing protein n=1 Tax=Streptomyces sp. NPDC016172 TaxID=3364964 RepID=UPI0036F8E558
MSEHRRKPPQPQGGGRAAARRGQSGSSSGRRAAPRGATGSLSDSYGSDSYDSGGEERQYGGRAEARRAAQRSTGGGRRRAAEPTRGGRRAAPAGRGRAAPVPDGKRLVDYPRAGKYGWQRWLPSWRLVSGLCIGFFGSLVAVAGIGYAMVGVPNEENAAALSQNNVYYWADGTQMVAAGSGQNRQNVTIDRIPKEMQWAVISAENKSFYQDSGVDPMGIARALANMARGGDTQGGSTITQQFVKNTYLSQEQTVTRKFKEMFISIKVGTKLTKGQILQGYLNTSYYGRGAYGIQAAAQAYYGKEAKDLTPSECAFLAALLKGPTYYDPAGNDSIAGATKDKNLKRSKDRWGWILEQMHNDKRITDKQYQDAIKKYPMPDDRKASRGMTGQIGYLADTAKKYVLNHSNITEKQFDQGGYQIKTTFEKSKVEALAKAVKKVEKEKLDPKNRELDKHVQFGAASVKPKDGAIVALYGGAGYENGHFNNNADTSGVPVGSTWKPFVLAAAMEHGTYRSNGPLSPLSKYNGNDHLKVRNNDGSYVLKKDNTPFFQENESDRPWGYISLRKAMEQSVNTPFVQLGMDVGMKNVADVAEKSGILNSSFAGLNASFALGTSTPSAIRMADAYATFAAAGKQAAPYSVTSVKANGQEIEGFDKPRITQAMPEKVAHNVTDTLENVIQNGTGKKALALGRTAAGKTGTTDENKSAWFVGYTQQLSTSVAMFREDPKSARLLSMNGTAGEKSIHGGDTPTQVWTEYMKAALKGKPDLGFPEAEKIGEIQDEVGAPTPTPTPSVEPSETVTESPSATPSESSTPSPTPSDTCGFFGCEEDGGAQNGGTGNGGTDGETSPEPTPTDTNLDGGSSRGNGNGGIFGGPEG